MTVALRRHCASPEEAARLAAAVAADDPGSVRVAQEGTDLLLEVRSPSPASARTTLDDLLACLTAAEGTLRASRSRTGPP